MNDIRETGLGIYSEVNQAGRNAKATAAKTAVDALATAEADFAKNGTLVTKDVFDAGSQGRYELATNVNWDTNRFLTTMSGTFDARVTTLKADLEQAFKAVTANASDPSALAKYQAALAEYTLYRNAQSNAVKAYKDVDAAIIRNFN